MIFAHIVGLTQQHKVYFYEKYKKSKYIFKDLDDLTDLIMDDKNMYSLIQRYEYYLNKSKNQNISKLQSKQFLVKSRELNNKINGYWKSRMEFYINEIKSNVEPSVNDDNKKLTILLGYSNFFRNVRTFVPINATVKIFINIDMDAYTKEIISTNIDTYRDDIISGNFNLDLINPTYLSKRRAMVEALYLKRTYDTKTFDDCVTFLGNSLENYEIPQVLFYASKYKYKGRIPLKEIIAYTDEWIAIVSSFKNNNLIKGYADDDCTKPYIQELEKNNIKKLKDKVFVYAITNTALFIPVFTKNYIYKYKLTQSAQIHQIIEIEDAYEKLKTMNISFVNIK